MKLENEIIRKAIIGAFGIIASLATWGITSGAKMILKHETQLEIIQHDLATIRNSMDDVKATKTMTNDIKTTIERIERRQRRGR